ncbi:hypothetical protein [Saccharothrix coeruleofusca]|uniref:hypothetical protein n=1 Tax=Saccharothrix coeruleofusca TaxID=33919 RepID=UPI00166FE717|nr:hypothetical protein [Saccharothrix coeruleofusca]
MSSLPVLVLGIAVTAPTTAEQARPTNGFSRGGPWNTKLPAHVPLDPRSAEIVDNIKLDKENNYGT